MFPLHFIVVPTSRPHPLGCKASLQITESRVGLRSPAPQERSPSTGSRAAISRGPLNRMNSLTGRSLPVGTTPRCPLTPLPTLLSSRPAAAAVPVAGGSPAAAAPWPYTAPSRQGSKPRGWVPGQLDDDQDVVYDVDYTWWVGFRVWGFGGSGVPHGVWGTSWGSGVCVTA